MCSTVHKENNRCVNYFCSCKYFYEDWSPWLVIGPSIERTRLNRFIGQILNLFRSESNVVAWQYRYLEERTFYNMAMSFLCKLFGTRHFVKVVILTREEQREAYDSLRRKYGILEDDSVTDTLTDTLMNKDE